MAGKRLNKWLRIILPVAVVLTWLGVSAVGGPYFGRIEEVSEVDLTAFLPRSAEATKVADRLGDFISDDTLAAIVVFEAADDAPLSEAQLSQINNAAKRVGQIDGVVGEVSPPIVSDDRKAAFVAVDASTEEGLESVIGETRETLDELALDNMSVQVTGPAGFAGPSANASALKLFGVDDGLTCERPTLPLAGPDCCISQ